VAVGDSPVIGAGTFASKLCAVSCTGAGEEFIRNVVAYDVNAIMEYTKSSLSEAASKVVHQKLKQGDGGLIAVDHTGAIAMDFNRYKCAFVDI
jgi:beta-aspartyl-peptidase (threonine type)